MQLPSWLFIVLAYFASISLTGATITFDGFSGDNVGPFSGITESGYTVSVIDGFWFQAQEFGNNVLSIYTRVLDDISGTISVTGGTFTLQSIDIAANDGDAAYTLVGLLSGATVFSNTGTMAGQYVPFFFETIANASSSLVIDTLNIHVNAATHPSSINLDNIEVSFAASQQPPETGVPEPATSALFGFGLSVVALRRLFKGRATKTR